MGLSPQAISKGLLVPTALELRADGVVAHWLLAWDSLPDGDGRLSHAGFRSSLIQGIRPAVSDDAGTNYSWMSGGMGGPADAAPAVWPGWSCYVPAVPTSASLLTFEVESQVWELRLT